MILTWMEVVRDIVNENLIDVHKIKFVFILNLFSKRCVFFLHLNTSNSRLIYWYKVVRLYDFYLNRNFQRYCKWEFDWYTKNKGN